MSSSGAKRGGANPIGPAGGDLGGAYPNPGVVALQGTPVSAVAPTNGQLFELVGGVWTPSTLVIPAAGATVTGPDAFGAAAAVGVSTAYSRADHDHGLPANPQRAPATTVTGPDAFGAAAAVGVSLLFARGDHDHGLPANPTAAFAVPAIVLGTAAAAGAAATKIRSDATIVAFDVTAPVTQAFGDAAAVGAAAVAARRDHKHGMPANPAPAASGTVAGPAAFGDAPVVGVSAAYSRGDHDHGLPAAPSGGHTLLSGFLFGSATNAAIASTQMSRMAPTTALASGLAVIPVAMVRAGAVTGISVTEVLNSMAAGTTRTYTVFVNGSATAVTVTASSTGSGTFSVEATGNVAVAAGDLVDVRFVCNQGFGGGTLRCEATVELAV